MVESPEKLFIPLAKEGIQRRRSELGQDTPSRYLATPASYCYHYNGGCERDQKSL